MRLLALLSALVWFWLLLGRGRFWQSGPELAARQPQSSPAVTAVVPARDEAAYIARSLGSLLAQDHAPFRVVLVNDESADGTGAIARGLADSRLTVLDGRPRPPGWSGKLWAVAQGIAEAEGEFVLLTDADIVHDRGHVSALVAKAEAEALDLVSEMVRLRCETPAERLLIPPFVYFFQLLYPFHWVGDPTRRVAAAAGGTMLLRHTALERIGGIGAIRGALIDDVALAEHVKRVGRIWLGHSRLARSLREYPRSADIWAMIARSAFVQLRYSWMLLGLTVLGMGVVFIVPPVAALSARGPARSLGLLAWAAETASYVPTLRRFGLRVFWAPLLPVAALFYLAATVGSAMHHALRGGVEWKRRIYREMSA